jgi:hypothetical protein
MRYSRKLMMSLLVAMIVSAATFAPSVVLAQKSAGWKIKGDYSPFWSNQSAARRLRHAADYSRGLNVYADNAKRVVPDAAKSEADELGHNLAAAQKEFAQIREAADDKEILALLDAIDQHLAKASEHYKQLHSECHGECKPSEIMMCCGTITQELEKAMAEHKKLMQTFAPQKPTGDKVEPAKTTDK